MKRVFLLPTILCLASLAAFAGDTVIEEIIARVNDQIITRSELKKATEQTAAEIRQQYTGADVDQKVAESEKNVLRDLIDQQLLSQKGKDLGLSVDTDVIKRLDEMRKQMNLPDMESLERAAAQQGASLEDYKQFLRNSLLAQKVMQQEVGGRINITPDEVQKFYDTHKAELERPEEVRLSEILVSTQVKGSKEGEVLEASPEQVAAAEKKINGIYQQLKSGAKFEDLAKQSSDGPTASEGGDLQYFKRGTLSKQLEDRTFAMKAGEFTEPIRTKQGYVVLKVTEHTQAGIPPLKDVEQQIMNYIYNEKMGPAVREYLTKLREEAFIDIKPGFVDAGASPNQTKPVITTASAANDAKQPEKKKKKFLIF